MKLRYTHLLYSFLFLSVVSCSSSDDNEIDEQKPTISINYTGGFPQACEMLQRGQTYTFKAQVTDNVALAAYSLGVHHNFDHHTHDDQGAQCELEDLKSAVDPLIYMENFSIEEGITSYEISIPFTIPDNVDTGDYHCTFSVVDETGWQSTTSVDVKIVE